MENRPLNSPRKAGVVWPKLTLPGHPNASHATPAPRPAVQLQVQASPPAAKPPPAARAAPSLRDWVAQYRALQEQGEQLEAACTVPACAGGRQAARDARAHAAGAHQLHAQLARQLQTVLTQLEGIQTACRRPGGALIQGLERQLLQFEASLSGLQDACAARLGELAIKEAATATELEAAARGLAAALDAPPCPTQLDVVPVPPAEDKPPTAVAAPAPQRRTAPPHSQSDLPPEVQECDAFLQRHGPTGGWDPEDHAEFERILKACRGVYSHAVQISCEELGLLHSREDIIRHARCACGEKGLNVHGKAA